jgi:hypothetical protein
MHSDKKATASRKTTVQRHPGVGSFVPKKKTKDKRAPVRSSFMITINTNLSFDNDPEEGNRMAEVFAETLDGIGFKGSTCKMWGKFFKVATGRGKKFLDKKETRPNPKHDPNYNSFYEQDDKQGIEHWCSLIDSLHVISAGVEWAPGTKYGKNQYLHAHVLVKVVHRTRLQVNCHELALYFKNAMD